MPDELTFGRQLRVLLAYGVAADGQQRTISQVLEHLPLSRQGLYNLLNDGSVPQLDTVRAICRFYDLSLDYFNCESEGECVQYLARYERLLPALRDILQVCEALSLRGRYSVAQLCALLREEGSSKPF